MIDWRSSFDDEAVDTDGDVVVMIPPPECKTGCAIWSSPGWQADNAAAGEQHFSGGNDDWRSGVGRLSWKTQFGALWRHVWRRFVLVVSVPCVAVFPLVQVKIYADELGQAEVALDHLGCDCRGKQDLVLWHGERRGGEDKGDFRFGWRNSGLSVAVAALKNDLTISASVRRCWFSPKNEKLVQFLSFTLSK